MDDGRAPPAPLLGIVAALAPPVAVAAFEPAVCCYLTGLAAAGLTGMVDG